MEALFKRLKNEDENYLGVLNHDLGIALRTNAVVHQIRCVRFGHFKLEHALLRKNWNLGYLMNNINQCKDLLDSVPRVTPLLSSESSNEKTVTQL